MAGHANRVPTVSLSWHHLANLCAAGADQTAGQLCRSATVAVQWSYIRQREISRAHGRPHLVWAVVQRWAGSRRSET